MMYFENQGCCCSVLQCLFFHTLSVSYFALYASNECSYKPRQNLRFSYAQSIYIDVGLDQNLGIELLLVATDICLTLFVGHDAINAASDQALHYLLTEGSIKI